MASPVLRVERVSKSFGNVRALHDVTLEFSQGEVHAVLGENGAGKSTLMGVLGGFVVPDSGRVTLSFPSQSLKGLSNDEERQRDPPHHGPGSMGLGFGRPHAVRKLGIEMVHQHFMLVPEFSVGENFALANLGGLKGALDMAAVEARAIEVAEDLGWQIDVRAKTRELPVGVQQRLEIVKALAGGARVLILDEPTAVLSPGEVSDLFRVLRRLRDAGTCVLLIAHKLSEAMAVSDRVSVLRGGEFVATAETADIDERTLAEWMVGELPAVSAPLPRTARASLLQATGIVVKGSRGEMSVCGASFSVSRGEILGIGGVDGNGQTELAEALTGLRAIAEGRVDWLEKGLKVGYVPQDRQGQGLALGMSALDNLLIGGLDQEALWSGPFLNGPRLKQHATGLVERYGITIGDLKGPVRNLSGGNQQKLVVSRVLSSSPDLVVACNPTRGLDVRATAYVQEQLLGAARNGAAVVLFSTDRDELAALSSRTLFMSRGLLTQGGEVGGAP